MKAGLILLASLAIIAVTINTAAAYPQEEEGSDVAATEAPKKGWFDKAKEKAKEAGEKIKETAKKVAKKVKEGVDHVVNKIKGNKDGVSNSTVAPMDNSGSESNDVAEESVLTR